MDFTLNHSGVEVTIMDGPHLREGVATPEAVEFYTRLISDLDNLRRHAAKRLLRLYNEAWVCEEIGPVDEQGFMQRLTNPRVTLFDAIGAAWVFFDDSNLFAGHCIEIFIHENLPMDAQLIG